MMEKLFFREPFDKREPNFPLVGEKKNFKPLIWLKYASLP